jgi:hypothetical protein
MEQSPLFVSANTGPQEENAAGTFVKAKCETQARRIRLIKAISHPQQAYALLRDCAGQAIANDYVRAVGEVGRSCTAARIEGTFSDFWRFSHIAPGAGRGAKGGHCLSLIKKRANTIFCAKFGIEFEHVLSAKVDKI